MLSRIDRTNSGANHSCTSGGANHSCTFRGSHKRAFPKRGSHDSLNILNASPGCPADDGAGG